MLEAAGPAAGGAAEPDAYAVVGMEHSATAAEVKKRYWRLSLLIHPDKCGHARANDAFQAVSRAAHDLQVPARLPLVHACHAPDIAALPHFPTPTRRWAGHGNHATGCMRAASLPGARMWRRPGMAAAWQDAGKRAAIDGAREDARLRRLAAEEAGRQERERQWRVARGTATAEDLRGPIRAGPAARDAWMTELPDAARPSAVPTQTNVVRQLAASRPGRAYDAMPQGCVAACCLGPQNLWQTAPNCSVASLASEGGWE